MNKNIALFVTSFIVLLLSVTILEARESIPYERNFYNDSFKVERVKLCRQVENNYGDDGIACIYLQYDPMSFVDTNRNLQINPHDLDNFWQQLLSSFFNRGWSQTTRSWKNDVELSHLDLTFIVKGRSLLPVVINSIGSNYKLEVVHFSRKQFRSLNIDIGNSRPIGNYKESFAEYLSEVHKKVDRRLNNMGLSPAPSRPSHHRPYHNTGPQNYIRPQQ